MQIAISALYADMNVITQIKRNMGLMSALIAAQRWTVMGMDEYIEREALMKETDRQRGEFISNKTIQFFPDTDVVPVRHGRWNDWEVFWKECSCCRYRTQKINAREYFFCPNCGAKMDLE